jgi:DNA-binding CsgD family transcriptional regulator
MKGNDYFKNTWEKFTSTIGSHKELETMDVHSLLNNSYFKNMFSGFPGFVLLHHYPTNNYIYASSSVKELLGYEPEEFYKGGVLWALGSIFIPSQALLFSRDIMPIIDKIYEEYIPKKEVENLAFTFSALFRKKNGDHILIEDHWKTIITDEEGNPLLGMAIVVPSLKKDNNTDMHFAIDKIDIHNNYGRIYENTFKIDSSFINLTEKQQTIIQLLSKGFSSAEIAGKLNLSKHTIDTHRRNLLKKTGCSNTIEMVQKFTNK